MLSRDKVLCFFRAALISVEFLFLMGGVLLFIYRNKLQFLEMLMQNYEIIKWMAFVPCCFLVWSLKAWNKIRNPDNEHVAFYQKWDGFESVKIVCGVGILYAISAAAGGIVVFSLSSSICKICMGIGLLTVILVSGACSLTMYMAEMRLLELLNQLKS